MNTRKQSNRRLGLAVALLLSCMSLSAHAEIVTRTLFDSTTLVTGTSLNLTQFKVTTPGTLVIQLDDRKWPALLDLLSFTVTDVTHVFDTFKLEQGATSGTWSFNVTDPGTFYGAIFAKPSAAAQAGMYHLNLSYQSDVAPVPLPAAAWLLLSGLAGLVGFRPKQQLSQTCA